MNDNPLTIVYLYPEEMSFYGDVGNVLALRRRLEWRGFSVKLVYHNVGDTLPKKADIIVGGGGQDEGQLRVQADFLRIGNEIQKFAEDNVPMLMICGMYQLFCKRFVLANKKVLQGIGIFDAETIATDKRLIGNVVTETEFGQLVGFENHSGQTRLGPNQRAFGKVKLGHGNDDSNRADGAVYRHAYGTYLHGALLPKNPKLADALIKQAFINRDGKAQNLSPIDDGLTIKIHTEARKRKS